jgi:hypothetical protein
MRHQFCVQCLWTRWFAYQLEWQVQHSTHIPSTFISEISYFSEDNDTFLSLRSRMVGCTISTWNMANHQTASDSSTLPECQPTAQNVNSEGCQVIWRCYSISINGTILLCSLHLHPVMTQLTDLWISVSTIENGPTLLDCAVYLSHVLPPIWPAGAWWYDNIGAAPGPHAAIDGNAHMWRTVIFLTCFACGKAANYNGILNFHTYLY